MAIVSQGDEPAVRSDFVHPVYAKPELLAVQPTRCEGPGEMERLLEETSGCLTVSMCCIIEMEIELGN